MQLAFLVGAAGLLTIAAFEDIIREAHESQEDSQVSSLALIMGFAIFVLVSSGLG